MEVFQSPMSKIYNCFWRAGAYGRHHGQGDTEDAHLRVRSVIFSSLHYRIVKRPVGIFWLNSLFTARVCVSDQIVRSWAKLLHENNIQRRKPVWCSDLTSQHCVTHWLSCNEAGEKTKGCKLVQHDWYGDGSIIVWGNISLDVQWMLNCTTRVTTGWCSATC